MNENAKAIQPISTDAAPAPGGHYAQGIRHGDTLYISGQLPVDPDGTHKPTAPFADQAALAIQNMLAVLKAAGGAPKDLLKVTVYVVGIANWPEFNRLYAEALGEVRPARSVVPVPELHYGYLVEIDAVAAITG